MSYLTLPLSGQVGSDMAVWNTYVSRMMDLPSNMPMVPNHGTLMTNLDCSAMPRNNRRNSFSIKKFLKEIFERLIGAVVNDKEKPDN